MFVPFAEMEKTGGGTDVEDVSKVTEEL